ncbi:hypothetical protein D9Q98_000965 [Chlorella vulgaris]|uniref:Dynein heavy chain n=1 Tax=Chlorella vulgaris TaxID=3077 RepID=A0A9D4TZC2_CHLVU|nr:hypothetical protein D9Q98_000965 [Chlorella vulgaris]
MPPEGGLFSILSLPSYVPLAILGPIQPAAVKSVPATNKGGPQTARGKAAAAAELQAAAVRTVEDAVAYFKTWGDSVTCQFFYALPDASNAEDSAAAEYNLQIVHPARTTHTKGCFYILSARQLVKVDRRTGETEAIPLEEWLAYKKAYHTLREQLTFFGSFALAKCFQRWRSNCQTRQQRRSRLQLQGGLLVACPAFQGVLLQAASVLADLRAVRTSAVQPGRLYTAGEWSQQQGLWRSRKAQPEVEAAVAALVEAAQAACVAVEAEAELMLASVRPCELHDRIGVELYAATNGARARSMQAIRQEKEERAAAYRRALANRSLLPRLLRLLNFQLAAALADMATSSVQDAATLLQAAAPEPLLGDGGSEDGIHSEGSQRLPAAEERQLTSAAAAAGPSEGPAASPAFRCSLVAALHGGGIAFSPSQEEWAAAVEAEVVACSRQLATSVLPLLSLPSLERFGGQGATQPAQGQEQGQGQEQQQGQSSAADLLAQQDGAFLAAAAQVAALLQRSFAEARQVALQYQQYLVILSFEQTWDHEAWAAQQRAAIDLVGARSILGQLQAWQKQLAEMPLTQTAGLLCLDAAQLKACLQPLVSTALGRVTGLLTQLGGGRCSALCTKLCKWREVAAARPADLEAGFLPWAAELALMQRELSGQLAAAAECDAALDLVEWSLGKLPTAEAVKRDDLKEVVQELPGELAVAAAWHLEQRAAHVEAVAGQARVLAEEAAQMEAELKAGGCGDARCTAEEMLADLELQQARLDSSATQAEALAQLQQDLGAETEAQGSGGEEAHRNAATVLQRCLDVWSLVAEAEAVHAGLAAAVDEAGEGGVLPLQAVRHDARATVAALAERLAAATADGNAAVGDDGAIIARARDAMQACHLLL